MQEIVTQAVCLFFERQFGADEVTTSRSRERLGETLWRDEAETQGFGDAATGSETRRPLRVVSVLASLSAVLALFRGGIFLRSRAYDGQQTGDSQGDSVAAGCEPSKAGLMREGRACGRRG